MHLKYITLNLNCEHWISLVKQKRMIDRPIIDNFTLAAIRYVARYHGRGCNPHAHYDVIDDVITRKL